MTDQETLDLVVSHGVCSADSVALGASAGGVTGAQLTEAIVRRAFECLIANGIVQIVPRKDWPSYILLDPPYQIGGHR